jgi:hypothetical protein
MIRAIIAFYSDWTAISQKEVSLTSAVDVLQRGHGLVKTHPLCSFSCHHHASFILQSHRRALLFLLIREINIGQRWLPSLCKVARNISSDDELAQRRRARGDRGKAT